MKKLLSIALIISIIFNIALTIKSFKSNQVQQTETTQSKQLITIKGELKDNNFYKNPGDQVYELSDGSWYLYNDETKLYVFQPVDLGDWDYKLQSKEQLEKIIKCYMSMKNNGYFE